MSAPAERASAARESRLPTQDGLGDFLRSLRAHWWIIVLLLAGAVGASTAWTVRQPRIYQASCTIEFDPTPARPLGEDIEDVAGPTTDFWMSREFFATQERVLASRLVAERVVQRLSLHQQRSFMPDPSALPESWQGVAVEDAARMLQERVNIEDVRGTRLVIVNVRDTEPNRAALIANTMVDVFIEKTIEDRLGSTVNALEWLGTQLETLRGQLERSELALHDFKIEHNVLSVALEDRQNLVAAEMEQFSSALTEARAERISLAARASRLRTILDADDVEEQASSLTEVESVQALRTELRAKLAEQDGMRERYGPNHPRMVELQAQIDGFRQQLRGELGGLMRAADADVRQAQVTEAGLRAALDQAQAAGLELNMREIEYSRLSRERDNNVKLYEVVLERTAAADISRMLRTTFVRMVDRALPPTIAIGPRLPLNVGIAGAIGLALGLLVAFVLGRLDTRIRTLDEFAEFGVTVLGILPKMEVSQPTRAARSRRRARDDVSDTARDLVTHHQPLSAVAENFRSIRTNLVFMSGERELGAVAVTSANPREGKTLIAANLAISLAQSGKRVLVIDTDLRRPRVHRAFGLRNDGGVTAVISGQSSFADAVRTTAVPGVDVMTAGPIPPNPAELLHREAFKQLLAEARRQYDIVLFDTPPLGAVIDAAVLAPQVDGVIVVARPGETRRPAMRGIIRQLADVGSNLIGVVVNGVDRRAGGDSYVGAGYYYSRDKSYYTADADEDAAVVNADDAQAAERRPHDS